MDHCYVHKIIRNLKYLVKNNIDNNNIYIIYNIIKNNNIFLVETFDLLDHGILYQKLQFQECYRIHLLV